MTQILVTGMHRSGTTLTFDLIRRFSSIEFAVNEGVVFDRESNRLLPPPFQSNKLPPKGSRLDPRPTESILVEPPREPSAATWVAKMSYPGPLILQQWCRRASDYCGLWLEHFGTSARILHVVRHPFAVFSSVRNRWGMDTVHLANYGPITLDMICRDWSLTVQQIEERFRDDSRVVTFKYEDLVKRSEVILKELSAACELPCGELSDVLSSELVTFGNINTSRACFDQPEINDLVSRSTSWLVTGVLRQLGYIN